LKSSVVLRWRSWMRSPKIQKIQAIDVCPRCGTQVAPSRVSIREMAVTVLCGGLLLSILIPACWLAQQWVERQDERMFERMIWHEPLDSWN
jgi:hypothetical protein